MTEEPKTGVFTVRIEVRSGTVAAEVTHVSGLLDLKARRLVADPAARWRERAGRPELLGLA